jgi:hypothetical protein
LSLQVRPSRQARYRAIELSISQAGRFVDGLAKNFENAR